METLKDIVSSLPHSPGVYIYKDDSGAIIYVGKAKDLKRRVTQYFSRDDAVGAKTLQLVSQIVSLETIDTQSEFDALILEASLIRKWNPKYNVISKDDKTPIYVSISMDEQLPRIECIRKTNIVEVPKRLFFGPFQSAGTLKKLLRQLRSIIPFCTQKKRNGSPCFYTHLGLCSPCASEIQGMPEGVDRTALVGQYRLQIRRIAAIFSGKSLDVLHDLEEDMKSYSNQQEYEKAQSTKRAVSFMRGMLKAHYDPALYVQSDSFVESVYEEEMQELTQKLLPFYPSISTVRRIECIDISNTQGTYSTGSLVVLQEGKSDTSGYRRFKIRTLEAPNDFAMIAEVISRRLGHPEWKFPDLLVIDGGKGQVRSAVSTMSRSGYSIPIIGLAKRFEEIIVPTANDFETIRLPVSSKALHMLERLRDESHRFALTYHRTLRKKAFLPASVVSP